MTESKMTPHSLSDDLIAVAADFERRAEYAKRAGHDAYGEPFTHAASLMRAVVSERTDLIAALRDMLAEYPVYRGKPIGAPGSNARAEHDRRIAIEDRARATLARAGVS